MPERGEAPDVVRIVEGLAGRVDDAQRAAAALRLRRRRAVGASPRRDARRGRRAGRGLAGLGRGAPRPRLRVVRRLRRRGRRHGELRADLAPVAPAPPAFGRPARSRWRRRERFWADWAERCTYDGPYRDAVVRSLVTLKGAHLRADRRHRRRGHDVAARGDRRASATGTTATAGCATRRFTLQALVKTGFREEARAWREWLLRAIAGSPERLQILYGVAGERRVPEQELPWLRRLRGVAAGAHRERRGRPAASSTSTAR